MNNRASDIETEVRTLLDALTTDADPAAFHTLLRLSQYLGECVGRSARTLAQSQSWSDVAGVAGTTKQAAWSRWRL
jgi:hypothetical protein